MADSPAIAALRRDPVLARQIDRFGELELTPAPDPFHRLIVAIINQQLSLASAAAIRERVLRLADFTPGSLRAADPDRLREAGLSWRKIDYLRSAADAFAEGALAGVNLAELPDRELVERLTKIHGVGVWTAKMFLIFSMARPDVFPVEDLGIRKGMTLLYGLDDERAMIDAAESWRPHRSLACLYVWRAYGAEGSGTPG